MQTLKRIGKALLLIILIPLTWWLTRTLIIFLDGQIDYSQLPWLPNLLVGLLMLAGRFFLPLVLTIIVFILAASRLYATTGSTTQSPQPSYYEFADTIYTQVVGVSYNNDDGSSRQRILSRCHSGDPVRLEFYTYRRAPAFAVITSHGRIGSLDAELARDIHKSYDEYRLSGVIASVYGGGAGKYYGCRIMITVEEKKYCEPLPPKPVEPNPTATSVQAAKRAVDQDLIYKITKTISESCPDLNALIPAVNAVMDAQCASVSTIHRRLALGYIESARLIDEMESLGIIGPFQGSKPREIRIIAEEWEIISSRLK